MKDMKKLKYKRIIIIFGILIIPLMYSYFYLSAFFDPYSMLENLPVAVVNKDQGAIINEKERNIGKELQDKMIESSDLKFCFVDLNEADKGLEEGKYYSTIIIPESFSKDISTASETEKKTANLIYSPNEKTNYLATQILNRAMVQLCDEVKSNVVGEVVTNLSNNLNQVPNKMTEINDGVLKISDGATKLNYGTNTLKNGTNKLSINYNIFNFGIITLKDNTVKLNQGVKNLDTGITNALSGANTLKDSTQNLYKINDSVKALNEGTNTLNTSANLYVDGVNQYISQSSEIGKKIATYVATNPGAMLDSNIQYIMSVLTNPTSSSQVTALVNGGTTLKAGTKNLNDNMALLSKGTKDLSKIYLGMTSLTTGLESIKSGSSAIASGTSELQNGTYKLANASNEILIGINTLNQGSNSLNNGMTDLKNGVDEANTKISNGIVDTKTNLQKLNGITDFAKEPVKVNQETVESVPNYGTAFSSYFMSLSLWVGGLIIFVGIYLDADEKFKILSRHSENKILRTVIYLLIGIAQAILLAFTLRIALKITVNNVFMYYLSCVLVSISFISIIQFFMINFKDAGKFIVILLLILQLTSCGGTFPMELVPSFFNKIFNFMPMTYSVRLFKEAISGSSMNVMLNNVIILASLFVIFSTFTIILGKIRKNKEIANS